MKENTFDVLTWGEYACFTRPELKVERVSAPIMTPSAARGVLEAIYWEPEMYYVIHQIAVVRKLLNGVAFGKGEWSGVRRNEVQSVISMGSARQWMKGTKPASPIQAGGGAQDGTQRNTLLLRNVVYLITAEVRLTAKARPPHDNLDKYLREIGNRASRGKCFHRPYLGCREFAADFDLVEDVDQFQYEDWTEDLGLLLYDVFDPVRRASERNVRPNPVFFDAKITNGRMDCHPDRVQLVRATREEIV